IRRVVVNQRFPSICRASRSGDGQQECQSEGQCRKKPCAGDVTEGFRAYLEQCPQGQGGEGGNRRGPEQRAQADQDAGEDDLPRGSVGSDSSRQRQSAEGEADGGDQQNAIQGKV